MAILMDPAGAEIRALGSATAWNNKQVLELGCGEGRLTLRLASLGPARIEAVDSDPDSIKAAREALPPSEKFRIRYRVDRAQELAYAPGSFDIVVFSWVL